mmetsp:Transcript_39583/g.92565  ORF Transcript_39583/g.92565 Transcript_39583/m.92565 type:complete len:402 (-) Transcript_39583:1168-2373(-)
MIMFSTHTSIFFYSYVHSATTLRPDMSSSSPPSISLVRIPGSTRSTFWLRIQFVPIYNQKTLVRKRCRNRRDISVINKSKTTARVDRGLFKERHKTDLCIRTEQLSKKSYKKMERGKNVLPTTLPNLLKRIFTDSSVIPSFKFLIKRLAGPPLVFRPPSPFLPSFSESERFPPRTLLPALTCLSPFSPSSPPRISFPLEALRRFDPPPPPLPCGRPPPCFSTLLSVLSLPGLVSLEGFGACGCALLLFFGEPNALSGTLPGKVKRLAHDPGATGAVLISPISPATSTSAGKGKGGSISSPLLSSAPISGVGSSSNSGSGAEGSCTACDSVSATDSASTSSITGDGSSTTSCSITFSTSGSSGSTTFTALTSVWSTIGSGVGTTIGGGGCMLSKNLKISFKT